MIVKKMKTFLEVEGKMGPIPQPTSSQYRPPQPDTNPNVRKYKATEKRKIAVHLSKDSRLIQLLSPMKQPHTHLQQSPRPQPISNLKCKKETPENRPPPLENAPVHKSTGWPGARKISGNIFEERKDWLLPPNYLDNNKVKDTSQCHQPKTSLKGGIPRLKNSPVPHPKNREVCMGTKFPLLQESRKRRRLWWQLPKSAANTARTRRFRCPKQGAPQDSKLPETPELFRNSIKRHQMIDIQVSQKSALAVGSRDGET